MRVLITGANGFIGYYLADILLKSGFQVIATGRGQCRLDFHDSPSFQYHSMDFTDKQEIEAVLEYTKPDVLVHAGAMGKPDDCELNRELAFKINVTGTKYLLEAAAKHSIRFIFLSTDFIFDGGKGMYRETDQPGPVNYYGITKLEAEQLVTSSKINWAIIRTVLVYGLPATGRKNLLTIVKEKLEAGEVYQVVDDQLRTPTYVGDLAKGLQMIISKKCSGIYHISGEEQLTPYQMACRTAEFLGLSKSLLKKVTANDFSQPAKRPLLTGFDISKAKMELGFQPVPFERGLQLTFGET